MQSSKLSRAGCHRLFRKSAQPAPVDPFLWEIGLFLLQSGFGRQSRLTTRPRDVAEASIVCSGNVFGENGIRACASSAPGSLLQFATTKKGGTAMDIDAAEIR